MKNIIISIFFMVFGVMQSQAFIDSVIKAEIIADDVSEAIKKSNKSKSVTDNVRLIHLWDGRFGKRECSCDFTNNLGLPDFRKHEHYCTIGGCIKNITEEIVPANEFNLMEEIKGKSGKGTLLLAYKLDGSPECVHVQYGVLEEPKVSMDWIFLIIIVLFLTLIISCLAILDKNNPMQHKTSIW